MRMRWRSRDGHWQRRLGRQGGSGWARHGLRDHDAIRNHHGWRLGQGTAGVGPGGGLRGHLDRGGADRGWHRGRHPGRRRGCGAAGGCRGRRKGLQGGRGRGIVALIRGRVPRARWQGGGQAAHKVVQRGELARRRVAECQMLASELGQTVALVQGRPLAGQHGDARPHGIRRLQGAGDLLVQHLAAVLGLIHV